MTQERMHPEDARRETALELYALYIATGTDDPSHKAAIQEADEFLAELARTAKPEAPKEDEHPTFPCESPAGNFPMEAIFYDQNGLITGVLYGKALPDSLIDRMTKAEARVNEMDNSLAVAESWRNDAALGLGEKRNKRIAELEQWQWDNMKKWLGIIGWGSMTPTQPECPTLIDAALQQGVEDAKRVDTLEARVKELEEAIKKHRSIVKGSHHWRGCNWDEDLLAKVNP